jgi:predicted short-subunit dehydrogenase-like oxidoreductase (DUF2520 family)
VLRHGDRALTGPVARGDVETVRAHLQVLAGSDALPAYVALARRTVERAVAAGLLSASSAEQVRDVLDEEQG